MSRSTKAKTLVEQLLKDHPSPLTLNNVYATVRQELGSIAFSTVYRIIHKLRREGKVVGLDWRDRGGRFEWAQRQHHHHLSCNSCGQVTDVDDALLNFKSDYISKKTGFIIEHHSIELLGTCKPCQKHD